MVKVSISLPNNAQITFESEEPEVIHDIVGMVLRDLPRDLMLATTPLNGEVDESPATEKSTSVGIHSSEDSGRIAPSEESGESSEDGGEASTQQKNDTDGAEKTRPVPPEPFRESVTSGRLKAQQAARSAAAEVAFIQFCQSVNPLGDMRKVVVAAEGAARFLEMDSVDTEDLGNLFDRVGWLHPHSFTQTLRNAARSKFRWMERVPGRSGHYTVTDLGRAITLDD